MPRWSASGSRWPRECTPPVARRSPSTTINDRNDRAPRLWAGRPWSRASVPNLASSLLLACVGLFALPGQAQTEVPEDWSLIPSGVGPGDSFRTATVTAVFDPAAGICGRTEEVRDAIVGRISGVTDCASVTDAHLAAITGRLDLRTKGITALAAGDFDGLAALTTLWLGDNSLATLPAGVFDELTALTELRLNTNSLTTLDDDVFEPLTALEVLWLSSNGLTTLPAGVFEPLTALTELRLNDNPGAPFASTADALPDDGTVSSAGGTVTLDGSGSGGPWGTNVTYSWAASGATVTFDDAASARPMVTIPALTVGTELTFTLTVTGRGATNGVAPDTDTATVTVVFDPTAGVCGRTEEVRDAIVALISGVTFCASVTDAHLAAITDRLDLRTKGITALAARDFDGLTALTTLWLGYNSLATLPDDVFGELTALTELRLNINSLTTLDDDVFEPLTALEVLWLSSNGLTTLPAGVFEPLTALTELRLNDNPGAPFASTADALPDDGTVSSAGGTVTLDGSGSGGPWGTNVTYSWAASGATVTFDDATSARPMVTIPALTVGTELTFTLTVTGGGATNGAAPDTDTATVTVEAAPVNASPSFTSPAAFNAPENQTAAGTVRASDSDAGDGVTGYAIQGGADVSKFSIVASTGVLTFASAPNFEAPADADTGNDYVVVVRATSGTGERAKTADQTITVTVTNAGGEAPGVPVAPSVSSASVTSVTATWTAPANAGPEITDYDYRHRVTSPQGSWTEVTTTTITALGATIAGLAEDTGYDVQVRATNGEGTSGWSGSGSGSTDANASPSFTSPETFNAPENQTAAGTVRASDSDAGDSVTDYAIQGGADRSKFSIVASTGVLTFASAPNFEAPADADTDGDYVVQVRATSGTGARAKTADQTITVAVTDAGGEAPGVPVAPSVSSASVTSVTATWTAPANAGPEITDYDYRHRVTSPQGSWTEVTTTTITALGATIAGLAEDTGYDVQVRATNDEGTSGWSASGSGSTDANASPSFTSPEAFNAPENQTAVGTVQASDSDAGDSVTGYAIQGGADASKFSIAPASGALTFASAPNFEAPADADTDNDYVVVVRATSGTGERAKTADQTITVAVTDAGGEAPGVPVAPRVSSASVTSVNVSWTAPANAGPAITDYDYRYRVTSPQGSWTEVTTTTITALGATIAGLAEDTGYDVQVRATNGEGTSGWSGSGSGSTDANASPSFTSPETFNAPENQTAAGTVRASDSDAGDSVTDYAIQGGADVSKFSIVEASGVLTFASAPNFEAPADADTGNDYVVVVRATSGTGERAKTADQTITVAVTNAGGEAPGVPVAPRVSSASVTSVNVSWTAPANAGPAITDYDYRHRVTSPQGSWTEVTTTTITALGATIAGLAEDTGYDVQVRATNGEGTSGWSGSGSGSTDANASPSFTSPAAFNAPENQTAAGTVRASDSDAGDSVTGYAIQGGADASKFSIAPASGALTFASAPNFEAPADADTGNDYVVVVRATSGTGERAKTADQTITVAVTNAGGEAPGVPVAPRVSSASVTSLNVSWTAPANAGPEITDYDYRHRVASPQGSWTEVTTTTITALGATIAGLAEDTGYDVQVRATNGEGTSGWSGSGSGSTDANASPSFTSPAAFNAPENQTAAGTVRASDSDAGDSVTGYAIQGGADVSKFSIVEASGVLTFASAPNFEAPADADTGNDYVVVVRATSGTGARAKTADQTITVAVTNAGGEAPGVPVAPRVSSASVTSLNVSWTAPANAGPEITDYDYRHRVASPQGSWTEVTTTTITALGATIAGLAEDTGYDVQVRAANDEGTSGWSASGSGSTDANASPSFTSPETFNAPENQTAAGTVRASDSDAGDSVTGYAIQGGADVSKFSIVEASGVLTFASAPNFEAPADADTGNDYVVVVRATSGTGERAKTADQTITVAVTNAGGEAPGVPVAPRVSSASVTSLNVSWTAPANAGPAITDYDYRHRVTSPQGSWTEVTTTTITALGATIAGLAEDTGYDVQVRAANDEGTSGWSASGSGSTDANAAPSFTSPAAFNAPENQTAAGTVRASDSDAGDSVTGYAIQGGADVSKFSIVEASGVLTFASAPNFEAPADADTGNDYVVVVRATSGTGARAKTADQTITVAVTNAGGEAPGVPVAPRVSSASVTSVNVSWTAPANAGPEITDYDYRHRVTSPQGSWTEVTTTTITALGATIAGLAEDTGYDVQVRATNGEGTSGWSGSGSGSTDANASPSFTSPETFNAPENQTAVGTVQASDSDAGDSVTGYAIQGGADVSKFSIVAATGVLTFASAPNFEAPADADTGNDYVVVVRATSGTGARAKTADQTITVAVTNAGGEAPGVPVAPSVSSASVTSVTATWTAPANAGPEITDYDYRHRVASPRGSWTEVTTTTITALGATIAGLAEDTGYDVQVRATNDEGTSGWSASGSGSTDANAAPSFTSPAAFNAPENQAAVGTVRASDSDAGDSVTGYAIQGGADRPKFSIVASTGVLTFASTPNFETPADADTGNDYVVVVRATSGTGARAKTADQTITVAVTNAGGEAPGVPAAPTVSSASVTSVNVSWTAPANAGPAITDYDYRHRVASPRGSWTEVTTTTVTALGATIAGLAENAGYDVQVRATNDEGTSGWSASGSGSTDANAAPSFTSPAAFNAPENQAAVGTVAASDSDGGDSVTGYAIQGGADASKFSIVEASGVLTFASAPNFEAPTDADTGNDYVVVVRATSGTGARAKAADQTITVTVTDMGGEAPGIPAAPSVSSASATSLNVSWTAPANAGPAITDYDYRHRVASPRGSWTEVTTTTITALGATIAGLAENTEYDVQVRATNDDGEGAWSQPGSGSTGEAAVVDAPALVGLFPRESDMVRQGFVRVINHSAEAGEVTVAATDDGGMRAGPVVLTLAGGATAHFNSDDLEAGNADKGLPEGVGPPGEGDWRLELESQLDIEVLSYIRTEDGFLTAMHDVAPVADGEHRVAIFNPAVNPDQVSRLRLINPTAEDAEVVVTGVDDDGASPGTEIVIDLPAGESATLTPTDLETGAGLDGALGDGAGKWRLAVASVRPIVVMSLLSSPTGHLTNLSSVSPGADDDGSHQVPLFPSASDPLGRQGFLRIVNRSADAGTVQVQAYDDSDVVYGIVTVAIGVGRTVHFNSDDLELGNADKGLAGSTGAGTGDWRLALSSDDLDDIQVLAYIRHDDGFLTSMHDVAPRTENGSRVAIFNPGINPNQVSSLRLVNPTAVDAEVTVTGIDDAGASPGTAVVLTVPAGDSRTLDAATLEDGGEDLDGALGDGKGKWRLMVTSEQPIVVMSLMTSATGQLTNLSTATDRDGT